MYFSDWFDSAKEDHVQAYETYLNSRNFPIGFVPDYVVFNVSWKSQINTKLARAYIKNFGRIHNGYDEKAEQGMRPTSFNYGYTRSKDGKYLVVKDEAKIVEQIFQLYLEFRSIGKVADYLRGAKRKTRRGKFFAPKTINNILRNSVYAGNFVWRTEVIEGDYQPIIDKDTFNCVASILEGNRKRTW